MRSSFGWYAIDGRQRDLMMEAVDQFRDKTTIDDLGLGAVRDSFSDLLFPGTSTLHTRLRYVLFLPWLMQIAATKQSVDDMQLEMRNLESRMVGSLEKGGENEGVIGIEARDTLMRPPSIVYWSGLKSWSIIEEGLSLRTYFERCFCRRELASQAPRREDPEAYLDAVKTGVDPGIPDSPDDLLNSAGFALRKDEAKYLADKITVAQPRSLFSHLINARPTVWSSLATAPENLWKPAIREGLPAELDTSVDLAERFSFHSHGANLLYNLLVAEKADREDRVDHYRERLEWWSGECSAVRPLDESDRQSIWRMVRDQGRNLTASTTEFFDAWFTRSPQSHHIAQDKKLQKMVRNREFKIKGVRGRLHNPKALDAWSGASGDARLTYRWDYAKRHLQDIYDGLEKG